MRPGIIPQKVIQRAIKMAKNALLVGNAEISFNKHG
jgi:hypothetical protein